MERNVRAVFYEYKYYLLPDVVSFGDIISNKDAVKLTRLKEDLCMAPDFVYESMAEEEVEFSVPERAFEVSVNLYTREEYDKILLEQVRKVCPGCMCYSTTGPDDTDLTGHHQEISLSGLCYLRDGQNDPTTFLSSAQWFWEGISEKLNELGKCIDRGDQKKLNKLINDELQSISYPLEFYGTVHDGKYCLCISTGRRLPYAYNSIVAYLAAVANQEDSEIKEAGWEVFPYYKKGIYRYDGKKSFDNGPALYLESCGFPFTFTVYVYAPNPEKLSEKKRDALLKEVRGRICEAVGEDVELSLVNGYDIDADGSKAESIDEVVKKLLEAYKSQADESEEQADGYEPFPRPCVFGTDNQLNEQDYLPYRHNINSGSTSAFDITLCPLEDLRKELWWTDFFTFAYFVFPEDVLMGLGENFQWYMTNSHLVPEPIGNPYDHDIRGLIVGSCVGGGYVFIDNFVFDEKALLRKIRILSPLFEGKGVRLITVNADGIKEYKCGFDMTVVGEKRWENE